MTRGWLWLWSGWLVVVVARGVEGVVREGEFVAGSFILTQKALDEAPYRYSGFLTQALEAMEMKDPPTKSDEENCNVRYRIEPSGKRSAIRVSQDSLRVNLLANSTVEIRAAVDVEVPAKTWIWKGINFGFLGCMKISSCGGQIVTYSAHIDMRVSFQVAWDPVVKKISVTIKPVETELTNVNVLGCHPPWYLWWFKSWQEMLNSGVQSAFQDFADNYSHSLTVPETTTIHKNIFISYQVTNLIWSRDFVAFEATATFKALIGGQNVTFMPNHANETAELSSIPIGQWPQSSATDPQSHLLQGVRLSGYFLNSIMWYASITNATEYQGNTTIMDSQINGSISYTPPIIKVGEEGVLNIMVPQGKLLAVCKPINEQRTNASILFKAEFSELGGSGSVKLAQGNKTGIIIEIEDLDLSNLKTKPFEPKLPLPETFESGLMRTGIAQLRPIINQYLKDKPIFLPEKVSPLVAYPEVFLSQSASGLGYAQVLSYCTCSDFQAPGAFSKCDERSNLCGGAGTGLRRKRETSGDSTTSNTAAPVSKQEPVDSNSIVLAESNGVLDTSLPKLATFLNQSSTFHKVVDAANNFLDKTFFNKTKDKTTNQNDMIISRNSPVTMDTTPVYLVQFETSDNCSMAGEGDNAKTYRLTPTSHCSPITVGQVKSAQYYVFKPDGSRMLFGCFDKLCKTCSFDLDIREKDTCIPSVNQAQSFVASYSPLAVENSLVDNNGSASVSIFFDVNKPCRFSGFYKDSSLSLAPAVMLASTYELGLADSGCLPMQSGEGNLLLQQTGMSDSGGNGTATFYRARFDCDADCVLCSYDIPDMSDRGDCVPYADESLVSLTVSELHLPTYILNVAEENGTALKMALVVGLSVTLVFLIISVAATVWCLQVSKSGEKRFMKYQALLREKANKLVSACSKKITAFFKTHVGIRFLNWKNDEAKYVLEDVVQNVLLLVNGICAILFAFEWNSPHNPLFLFSTKLTSKAGVGSDILEMHKVLQFTDSLNFWTYTVNLFNGSVAFLIIVLWCFSKTVGREQWTKLRLASSTMMLISILLTIACVIFTTYFDDLIQLKTNSGYFITDNIKMRKISETVIKVSLNGLSLTVISFTIVFLFHGVGGGLFSGTVLFRILHLYSKKENLEILTTLLVILTIIQPFICLHPVIIWSQDSNHNFSYLILTIFVWFLPLMVHLFIKLILTQINKRYINRAKMGLSQSELTPLNDTSVSGKKSKTGSPLSTGVPKKTSRVANVKESPIQPAAVTKQVSNKILTLIDIGMQVIQLILFLTVFSFVTHYIIHMELDSSRANLKNFVLPAIISVFFWMMSISYFLLDLTMNATKDSTPLVFKDQSAVDARSELHRSLRRRLSMMDKRSTVGGRGTSIRRPLRPPPPPPTTRLIEREGKPMGGAGPVDKPAVPPRPPYLRVPHQRSVEKSRSLPPIELRSGPRSVRGPILANKPEVPKSGDSVKIKIREAAKDEFAESTETLQSNLESQDGSYIEPMEVEEVSYSGPKESCCSKFLNYILERQEYAYPELHGWRIKFRRIFLHLGVLGFTYTTYETIVATQSYSAKKEIQKILDYVGTNLTWPDEGSALDDVFQLYNETQQRKSYVMIVASLLFFSSLALDITGYWSRRKGVKDVCVLSSRVVNFLGSLLVFASVILVGLPDYLEASNLDEICPYCGSEFNRTVKQVAEFSIGLFFACLFTFQLLPVLMTIAPALVRASVLILIHPGLRSQDPTTVLRMSILQKVIVVSSLLSFPITFVSMCIVDQHQKDVVVTVLIFLFWTLPPVTLYVGLHYSRSYQKYSILLFVYYMYNFVYVGLVLALLLYSFQLQQFLRIVRNMLESPTVWFGTMAQVFLCNVVISDLLYMTVF